MRMQGKIYIGRECERERKKERETEKEETETEKEKERGVPVRRMKYQIHLKLHV
jgi:hypothetical protein